ncbi:unnamed protein product [Effrenium voratum]|nr:unnamed protein product [Effrenium voratum]
MPSLRVQANDIHLSVALKACRGTWRQALTLLLDCENGNAVHLGLALSALRQRWPAALALLTATRLRQLEPSTRACSQAVACCQGAWHVALAVLQDMQDAAIALDQICCSQAVSILGASGRWQHALALTEQMLRMELVPDQITWNAVLSACEKGGAWWGALSLLTRMQREQVRVDLISFSAAIGACSKCRVWQQSLHLLHQVPSCGLRADRVAHNAAITGPWPTAFALLGEADEAMELYHRMASPDAISCNALMTAFEQHGETGRQWRRAVDLLGRECDEVTYAAMRLEQFLRSPPTLQMASAMDADGWGFADVLEACLLGRQWQRLPELLGHLTAPGRASREPGRGVGSRSCGSGGCDLAWAPSLPRVVQAKASG